MVDNEILKRRLSKHLASLDLNDKDKDRIVRELNYLSSVIIDGYLEKKNGQRQTTTSK